MCVCVFSFGHLSALLTKNGFVFLFSSFLPHLLELPTIHLDS